MAYSDLLQDAVYETLESFKNVVVLSLQILEEAEEESSPKEPSKRRRHSYKRRLDPANVARRASTSAPSLRLIVLDIQTPIVCKKARFCVTEGENGNTRLREVSAGVATSMLKSLL